MELNRVSQRMYKWTQQVASDKAQQGVGDLWILTLVTPVIDYRDDYDGGAKHHLSDKVQTAKLLASGKA